jgi:hypothetical protein
LQLGAFEIAYGEAWLLETAVRAFIPLTFLVMSDEDISGQFNRPGHHMPRAELLRTLCLLFMRSDLIGYQEALGEHVPTAEQIDTALVPPVRLPNGGIAWGCGAHGPLSYSLSQAGAARWERMAEPDWERYFEDRWAEKDTYEVVAGSQIRLEELLNNARELWDVEPDGEVTERDVITPWEATYWKTLPAGYLARFRCRLRPYEERARTQESKMEIGLRRWCRSVWDTPR